MPGVLRLWLLVLLVAGSAAPRGGHVAAEDGPWGGRQALTEATGIDGKVKDIPRQTLSRGLQQAVVDPISPDEALLEAAQRGDLADAEAAILQGADVEARGPSGFTPLIEASSQGFLPMVSYLLSEDADVEATSDEGVTALLAACQAGQREVVDVLLDEGADVEAVSEDGTTPIIAAAENGRGIVLLMLLAEGADPNSENLRGETALFSVSAYDNTTFLVENIVDRGGDPNHQDANLSTPLHRTAFYGNLQNAWALLRKGAKETAVNAAGELPGDLVCGCRDGPPFEEALPCPLGFCEGGEDEEGLKTVLGVPQSLAGGSGALAPDPGPEIGAGLASPALAPSASPSTGLVASPAPSPATGATGSPATGTTASPLPNLPASPDFSQKELDESLMQGAMDGDVDAVEAALVAGANTESRDESGFTPLIMASFLGHDPVVDALLAAGADVEARDNLGFTALQAASQEGRLAVVRTLLLVDADAGTQSNNRATPLIKAAEGGHLPVVRALLAAGADPDGCCTQDNGTAIIVAAETNNLQIVVELIDHDADAGAATAGGQNALFKASAHLDTGEMLNVLLDGGAPVNHRDAFNDTALGYAAFFGNKENVKLLLGEGADPDIRNGAGEVAADGVCGCLANEGLEDFLQCPPGACDNEKNRKKIAKLLRQGGKQKG